MTNRRKYINHKVTRRDFYYSKYRNRNCECELLSRLIPQRHRRLVRMEIYGHTHNDNPGSQFSDYHRHTSPEGNLDFGGYYYDNSTAGLYHYSIFLSPGDSSSLYYLYHWFNSGTVILIVSTVWSYGLGSVLRHHFP